MDFIRLSLEDFARKPLNMTTENIDFYNQELKQLRKINENESEEHQKNALCRFISNLHNYRMNTKDRIDLAIYDNFNNPSPLVIFEVKSLSNKSEFPKNIRSLFPAKNDLPPPIPKPFMKVFSTI